MPRLHSRRQFLRQSAVLAAGACATVALADEHVDRRNGRVRVGIVGVDEFQRRLSAVARSSGAEVAALCGAAGPLRGRMSAAHATAVVYDEPLRMIDEAELDAIMIGPCLPEGEDAARRALERGLHVYSPLPLGRSIDEAQELAELARRSGAVTQVDVRSASPESDRHVVERLRSGAIGRIREVVCWSRSAGCRDFQSQGVRLLAAPMRALDLNHPTSIYAAGTTPPGAGFPSGLAVRYRFPADERGRSVQMTWYDGDWAPPYESLDGVMLSDTGTLYLGEGGHLLDDMGHGRATLHLDGQSPRELPAGAVAEHDALRSWLAACQGASCELTGVDAAAVLQQNVLAGLVAYRIQQRVEWDGPAMRAYNSLQADALIRPTPESIHSA